MWKTYIYIYMYMSIHMYRCAHMCERVQKPESQKKVVIDPVLAAHSPRGSIGSPAKP